MQKSNTGNYSSLIDIVKNTQFQSFNQTELSDATIDKPIVCKYTRQNMTVTIRWSDISPHQSIIEIKDEENTMMAHTFDKNAVAHILHDCIQANEHNWSINVNQCRNSWLNHMITAAQENWESIIFNEFQTRL